MKKPFFTIGLPGWSDKLAGNGAYFSGCVEGEAGNKCNVPTSSESNIGMSILSLGQCSGFWAKLYGMVIL